jgi:ribose transport system permease protein
MTMADVQTSSETKIATTEGGLLSRVLANEFMWIWLGTAILFVVSGFLAPGTVKLSSIAAMLPFAAMLAIAAVGQTVVIQQRGLDMSLPGMMTAGGIAFATLSFATDSIPLTFIFTFMIAIAIGTINGLLVAKLNITPIVATLATNAIMMGAIRQISRGSPITVPQYLDDFSHIRFGGLPLTLGLALLFVILVSVMTRSTVMGRRFVAVGANPVTALAAGIPVLRYQVGTYALASVCFCVAGILYAGYIGSASQVAGNEYLLPAIAAVVVGGTPFSGGRGSVVASGVAALFMTQLGQLVLSLGASTPVQLLVQAGAIVLAMTIRHLPSVLAFIRMK